MSDGLEAYRKIVESIGRDSVAAVWHVLASSSSKAVPIKGADLFLLAGVHERVGTLVHVVVIHSEGRRSVQESSSAKATSTSLP